MGTGLSYCPPPSLSPLGVLIALSPPLITNIWWKAVMGNVQTLSAVCVTYEYDYFFRPTPSALQERAKTWKNALCQLQRESNGCGHFSPFKSAWLPVSKLCNLHPWVWVMEPRTLEGGLGGMMGVGIVLGGRDEAQSPVFIVILQSPLCISTI